LDVGIGFGRWGILAREFLEVWNGKVFKKDWQIQIDGIEIFSDNIKDYHDYFYSNIFNEDAFDNVKNTNEFYDLIIIGDVLEHFEKVKANDFLQLCLSKSRFTLLNLPIGRDWQQEEVYGNPFEKHKSFWQINEINNEQCITYKVFRDIIGRKFSVFILSKSYPTGFSFKKFKQKLIFQFDNYTVLKKLLKTTFKSVKSNNWMA